MSRNGGAEMIALKRWHLILTLVTSIVAPAVAVTAAYFSKESAVKEMIHAVDSRVQDLALKSEEKFARKDDVSKLQDNVGIIKSDVSEIKGYLQTGNWSRRRRR